MKFNKNSPNNEKIDNNIGDLCNDIDSSKGILCKLYYVIFSIRRVIFSIILIALKGYGIIQMALIVAMNFGIILYLLITKPFKDNAMNYYNIFNEILTSVIFIILSIFLIDISDISTNQLDLGAFYLIYVFYAIQALICIGYVVKTIRKSAHLNKSKSKTIAIVFQSDEAEVFKLNDNRSSMEISRLEVYEENNTPLKNASSNLEKKDLNVDEID